jgi:hypothetical protein
LAAGVAGAPLRVVDRATHGAQRDVLDGVDGVHFHVAEQFVEEDAAVAGREHPVIEGIEHADAVVAIDVDLEIVGGLPMPPVEGVGVSEVGIPEVIVMLTPVTSMVGLLSASRIFRGDVSVTSPAVEWM